MSIAIISIITMAGLLFLLLAYLLWERRYLWIEGYHRVTFIREDKNEIHALIKLSVDDEKFTFRRKKYIVEKDSILHAGRLRLPQMYYIFGRAEPLDLLGMKDQTQLSALDYEIVAENTVAQQLLSAFIPPFISPTMSFLIISGLVVISAIGVYLGVTNKLHELHQIDAPISVAPQTRIGP